MYKNIIKAILDFVFPRNCMKCNELNPKGNYDYICENCAKLIHEENQTRCLKCGEFIYFNSDLDSCVKCFDLKFYFRETFCAVVYKDINATLVKELKYRKGLYLLNDMSKIFHSLEKLNSYIENSVLVPVPLHKKKQKARTFYKVWNLLKFYQRRLVYQTY